MRLKYRILLGLPAVAALVLAAWWLWPTQKAVDLSSALPSFYTSQVEPVLSKRCLACHGCYSSPCQLNFQSPDGATRGALKMDVLNGTRLQSVQPTRLGIDAKGREQWQGLGFFDVTTNGILRAMLELKQKNPGNLATERPDREARKCPSNAAEMNAYATLHPEGGMPYGLPQLSAEELQILSTWLDSGAKTDGSEVPLQDTLASFSPRLSGQIHQWQEFLNGISARERLVARYVFEHLFLAHIYFADSPGQFFRLVRSRVPCASFGGSGSEINTPRPNDDPGTERPFYCLSPLKEKIVEKNHMAFALNAARLERWQELFLGGDWQVTTPPNYDSHVASNPFLAFQDIPVRSRYEFLLGDARYHISTFIKGPVCNGSVAVNSVQEQFYVFFLAPDADPLVMNESFSRQTQTLLELPGGWGRDINPLDLPFRYHQSVEVRNQFRELRAAAGVALRPSGYSLNDIWDGDGSNPNALLTVLRHNESAFVLQGARGDLSKTVLAVDYSIFERLVYNLVVNFDVFANVGHQLMTRTYMTLIRMEAEELFLQFLPRNERKRVRAEWYQGPFTTLEMSFRYPMIGLDHESAIQFKDPHNAKLEFVNRVLFEHLREEVRGATDLINWRHTQIPVYAPQEKFQKTLQRNSEQEVFRAIAGVRAESAEFPKFFPDFSLLEVIDTEGVPRRLYSIVRNKELRSLAWIFQEASRRAEWEDSLLIFEGLTGSYPNLFFRVNETEIDDFRAQVVAIRSQSDWYRLIVKFGVPRTHGDFWQIYDEFQILVDRYQGIETGVLDLSRYE